MPPNTAARGVHVAATSDQNGVLHTADRHSVNASNARSAPVWTTERRSSLGLVENWALNNFRVYNFAAVFDHMR